MTFHVLNKKKVEFFKSQGIYLESGLILAHMLVLAENFIQRRFGENILCCTCTIEVVVGALDRVDVTLLRHKKDYHHLAHSLRMEALKCKFCQILNFCDFKKVAEIYRRR